MTKSFKAAIYETHGNPAEVLRIVDAMRKPPSEGHTHGGHLRWVEQG